MPGANCCFPQCGSSRRKRGLPDEEMEDSNIGIFKITNRKGEFFSSWRKQVLDIVRKYRVFDEEFQQQLDNGTVAICDKHYKKEDIELTKTGKKTLKLYALPTENLAVTSHQKSTIAVTRPLIRHDQRTGEIETNAASSHIYYKNISELKSRITNLKLGDSTNCSKADS